MRTWSRNLKKCLTANLIASFVLASVSYASVSSPIYRSILSDLQHLKRGSFEPLLSSWEKHYGTDAVPSLLDIARDTKNDDPIRYIAMMGVAKIGGRDSATLITPFLRDTSWMIRNGALRALSALRNPTTTAAVLPLLNDPALVVRLEAVQSLDRLRPDGTARALILVIQDPNNYHAGHAQWVPQKALEVLRHMGAQNSLSASENRETVSKLTAMLDGPMLKDPALKPEIQSTLRALNKN